MLLVMGFVIYVVLLVTTMGYALVFGGMTERKVAGAWAMGVVASQIASQFGSRWTEPEVLVFLVDLTLFVLLFVIAHRSERFWPLWTAAFQLAGVLTHLAFMVQPTIVRNAYAGLQGFWGIPILCTLILGTATEHLRQRKAISS